MKIIDYTKLITEFDCKELELVINSMQFVFNAIEDWEFLIRLGVERYEFLQIINRIKKIQYESINKKGETSRENNNINENEVKFNTTKNELLGIGNALNEVCNGIEVPEFEKTIGADESTVYLLLKQISKEFKRVNVD